MRETQPKETAERLTLCVHGRMWLAPGHTCNCIVLKIEWMKRRGTAGK